MVITQNSSIVSILFADLLALHFATFLCFILVFYQGTREREKKSAVWIPAST